MQNILDNSYKKQSFQTKTFLIQYGQICLIQVPDNPDLFIRTKMLRIKQKQPEKYIWII